MKALWKESLWQQFGAAIDMLENAINACPKEIWGKRLGIHEFWYMVYHTLFFLDYYLSESETGFAPPAPFTLGELDPAGVLPDRIYSQEELLTYLQHGRAKGRARVAALTEESAQRPCGFGGRKLTVIELHLYNMRHVQHHAAQLNLLLRQQINTAPRWVGQAKDTLDSN